MPPQNLKSRSAVEGVQSLAVPFFVLAGVMLEKTGLVVQALALIHDG
jgi:TRAP-type mannitol/chloroaromatic compound transport system permease large subunit